MELYWTLFNKVTLWGKIIRMEKNYLNRLVQRFFEKKIDSEELDELNEWYDLLDTHKSPAPGNRKSASWAHINDLLEDSPKKTSQFKLMPWLGRVAAVALIAVCIYAVFQQRSIEKPVFVSQAGSFTNKIGAVSSFLLPDSTQVWLSSGSKLDYGEDFKKHRRVNLKGEAFFQVKRDSLHPFEIQIGEMTTEVLGTSFNLKGYDEKSVELQVYTGKVKFSHQDQQHEAQFLTKNQKTSWDHRLGMQSIQTFDSSLLPDWKQGVFRFEQASIHDIVGELEKWYPLDFKLLNGSGKNSCDYSGEFANSSLEQVLEILSYTLNISYQINANEVLIKLKSCN